MSCLHPNFQVKLLRGYLLARLQQSVDGLLHQITPKGEGRSGNRHFFPRKALALTMAAEAKMAEKGEPKVGIEAVGFEDFGLDDRLLKVSGLLSSR